MRDPARSSRSSPPTAPTAGRRGSRCNQAAALRAAGHDVEPRRRGRGLRRRCPPSVDGHRGATCSPCAGCCPGPASRVCASPAPAALAAHGAARRGRRARPPGARPGHAAGRAARPARGAPLRPADARHDRPQRRTRWPVRSTPLAATPSCADASARAAPDRPRARDASAVAGPGLRARRAGERRPGPSPRADPDGARGALPGPARAPQAARPVRVRRPSAWPSAPRRPLHPGRARTRARVTPYARCSPRRRRRTDRVGGAPAARRGPRHASPGPRSRCCRASTSPSRCPSSRRWRRACPSSSRTPAGSPAASGARARAWSRGPTSSHWWTPSTGCWSARRGARRGPAGRRAAGRAG